MRPIELLPWLVNQMAPPELTAMPSGLLTAISIPGPVHAFRRPVAGSIRPIDALPSLVTHTAPSGPVVSPLGPLIPEPVKIVTRPAVVIRPIADLPTLLNHNAPSGPGA